MLWIVGREPRNWYGTGLKFCSHVFGYSRGEDVVELATCWIAAGDDIVSPCAKMGA